MCERGHDRAFASSMCHYEIDCLIDVLQIGALDCSVNFDTVFPWLQIARKICYSVDLSWGGSTQLLLHVLETVIDSVVRVKVISFFYLCYWKSVVISLLCTFQLL